MSATIPTLDDVVCPACITAMDEDGGVAEELRGPGQDGVPCMLMRGGTHNGAQILRREGSFDQAVDEYQVVIAAPTAASVMALVKYSVPSVPK